MSLSGQVALVTGGARGIGAAIAIALSAAGADVVVADIGDGISVIDTIRKKKKRAWYYQVDVSDRMNVEEMVRNVEKDAGPIEVLVNNAGMIVRGTITDLSHEQWARVFAVNVTGTFNCCKATVPRMIEMRTGNIVNITSVAGKMGDVAAAPAYGASKGAVNAFTKSLARQLAVYGIRVNGVAPHAIETDMSAEWGEEMRCSIIAGIPLGRLGTVEDVAEAVVYLASDRARFVTGEILNVNGGFLMD